jgi:hypothetical protein
LRYPRPSKKYRNLHDIASSATFSLIVHFTRSLVRSGSSTPPQYRLKYQFHKQGTACHLVSHQSYSPIGSFRTLKFNPSILCARSQPSLSSAERKIDECDRKCVSRRVPSYRNRTSLIPASPQISQNCGGGGGGGVVRECKTSLPRKRYWRHIIASLPPSYSLPDLLER